MVRKVKAPLYHILVRMTPFKAERKQATSGGILLLDKTESELELERQGMRIGHVVSMGSLACKESPKEIKIGDCVLIHKHAGTILPDMNDPEDRDYRMVLDIDIQAIFPEEGVKIDE